MRRRQFLAFMSASATAWPLVARAQPAAGLPQPSATESAAMADLAGDFMNKYAAPALSIAVGYDGSIIYQDAFGLADRENRQAATPENLFRIASVSKTLTSVAIFSLVETGRIKLADKVFGQDAITWWHNGSLPGTITIAVRTHSGFCWAGFTNTRRRNPAMGGDLDRLIWTMARQVKAWPV